MQFNRDKLLAMGGPASYKRGEEYFLRGCVRNIHEYQGVITAKIYGQREYTVKFWDNKGILKYSCTCPVGAEGGFCKHCVAAGLAWIDNNSNTHSPTTITLDDIKAWLARQKNDCLVDILIQWVSADERLFQNLMLKAAKASNKAVAIATYQHAIDNATHVCGFLDYHGSSDYAHAVLEVITPLYDIINEGLAVEAVDLIEYTIKRVAIALNEADDSNGEIGGVLYKLQNLHYQACQNAKPDQEELAKKLFAWELAMSCDIFYQSAKKYADILGQKGIMIYRKLAEAEWAKVPALTKYTRDSGRYGDRFRITSIMEGLARMTGNIDDLVDIEKRDLSSSYRYLKIAEIYHGAKLYEQALEWAEKGAAVFVSETDPRLRDFLAEEYHRRKQHEKAIEQIWMQFTESPYLTQYEKLKKHADRIKQWHVWRDKALQLIRDKNKTSKQESAKNCWHQSQGHSELVRIFIWEKKIDLAWEEARSGGCKKDLWLQLAEYREKNYPEDALPIYQKQIEPLIGEMHNNAYHNAIYFIVKIHSLMVRLKRENDFQKYLALLRVTHKSKRNFIKYLQEAGF